MNTNNEIFVKIKHFMLNNFAVYENKVNEEASLEKDLGIYGDEACDFLIAFGKEFHVDVSKFMAADYFSPEGDKILPTVIRFFFGIKKKKLKDFKIKHLIKAVEAGKLDDEIMLK